MKPMSQSLSGAFSHPITECFGGYAGSRSLSRKASCQSLISATSPLHDIATLKRENTSLTPKPLNLVSSQSCQQGVGSMRNVLFQDILAKIIPKSPLMEEFVSAAGRHFSHNSYNNIWVGVHKDALIRNVELLRAVSPNKKFCAVLKCDAYGHGIELVAPVIADKVDSFAITENREAALLRSMPCSQLKPIQRVRIADSFDIAEALDQNLNIQELVGSYDHALTIANRATQFAKPPVDIHLSLDSTQMGRDGFSTHPQSWDATVDQFKAIADNPALRIVGITSHLPTSDTEDFSRSNEMLKDYVSKASYLKSLCPLPEEVDIHAFASAGTLRQKEVPDDVLHHITLNRAGAAIFGQASYENQDVSAFTQAMSACTFVGDVFERQQGSTVGYGSHYTVSNQAELHANIPGGWNLFPREVLKGQARVDGVAPIAVLNQLGGHHLILGNPSMNSIVCNARSTDGQHSLSRMEPVFYLADHRYLPQKGIQQDTDMLSRLVSSTGARISIQLGNPLYAARMLLKGPD